MGEGFAKRGLLFNVVSGQRIAWIGSADYCGGERWGGETALSRAEQCSEAECIGVTRDIDQESECSTATHSISIQDNSINQ